MKDVDDAIKPFAILSAHPNLAGESNKRRQLFGRDSGLRAEPADVETRPNRMQGLA